MAPARGADGTGATREGCALLQGLAICGICGRRLGVFYRGPAKSIPGYQCNGGVLVARGLEAEWESAGWPSTTTTR